MFPRCALPTHLTHSIIRMLYEETTGETVSEVRRMLVKCPKCELNYMDSADKMCKVCFREIHGSDMPEELELCGVCNEVPVLPGKDVCSLCQRELNAQRALTGEAELGEEPLDAEDDVISSMDEIVPDLSDTGDIPEPEFQEIDRNLSLDELSEQEEADSNAEDEDDS